MGESQKHDAKWKKPDVGYVLCDFVMKCPAKATLEREKVD